MKKDIKTLSPIDLYMLLPRTNCKECGEANCMAFAAKLVNREASLEDCPPLLEGKYKESYIKLKEILEPPIREITIGVGDNIIKIGGKLVFYRHDFTYHNPVTLAFDVTDEMPMQSRFSDEESILDRIKKVENFSYEYIGRQLKLDMIAVRSTSNNPDAFGSAVTKIAKKTMKPMISPIHSM